MPPVRPIQSRGRPTPPPPPRPKPSRLSMLRAHSGFLERDSTQRGANWLTSAAVYLGAAVAGAVWIGGSLFDLGRAAGTLADHSAAASGFSAGVEVRGVSGERQAQIQSQVLPQGMRSVWAVDPHHVRARLMALDWVDKVTVMRRWPDSVIVDVSPKPSVVAAMASVGL